MTSQVNQLVGLLSQFAPDKLEELRIQFPDQSQLLQEGIVAGERIFDGQELMASASICLVALKESDGLCDNALKTLDIRFRRGKQLRLISEILTIIAGSSLFITLREDVPRVFGYVSASLVLAGALSAVVSNYFSAASHIGADSLETSFTKLVELRPDMRRLIGEIEYLISEISVQDDRLIQLISDGNHLASQVYKNVRPLIG